MTQGIALYIKEHWSVSVFVPGLRLRRCEYQKCKYAQNKQEKNDTTLIRIEEYVIVFPAKMFVKNLKKSFVFFSRAQSRRTP